MKKITTLIEYLIRCLNSYDFKCQHRFRVEDFSRNCKLDFKNTTLLILNILKRSIKADIMNYFSILNSPLLMPSRQAFSAAREKVSYTAFKDFFDKSCEVALTNEVQNKLGYRMLAVDGTTFVVGDLEKLSSFFGESTSVQGKAMGRISAIVDIDTQNIVSAKVAPFHIGERALAITQVNELCEVPNALFIFDRGYWSPTLVRSLYNNNQSFLIRLQSNVFSDITSDGSGYINHVCGKLRYYSFMLSSGVRETLVTNLSREEISDVDLGALYAKRWAVETKFLELKDRLQLNEFTIITVNAILQDIYSALFISNMVAFVCEEVDKELAIKSQKKKNKYPQKANRSVAIIAFRLFFVKIIVMADEKYTKQMLLCLRDEIAKNVIYIGSSDARKREYKKLKNSKNRKKSLL